MAEELSIVMATPVVTLTKAKGYNSERFVEVRAGAHPTTALSIHYTANMDDGGVPTVQDKLLVAVLSGVRREWLHPITNQPVEGGEVPITFEAVSANARGGANPPRAGQFDTLHFSTVNEKGLNGALKRLHVSMRSESGHVVHAAVVLSKGQVTSMLAALLAIYPRLCEE